MPGEQSRLLTSASIGGAVRTASISSGSRNINTTSESSPLSPRRKWKTQWVLCGLIALCIAALAGEYFITRDPQRSRQWYYIPRSVVNGNDAFAVDLYRRAAGETQGNLFFSPVGVSIAMAMAHAGARGDTAAAIAKVMHYSLPPAELRKGLSSLLSELNEATDDGNQLAIANRLWGQRGFPFQRPFLDGIHDAYGAELEEVDFISNADHARRAINAWAAQQSSGKIGDLLDSGGLSSDTRLVLTSSTNFKGVWQFKFDLGSSHMAPFHVSRERSVDTMFMYQKARFKYGRSMSLATLELPYKGGQFSMLVLLPHEIDGLEEIEKTMSVENLRHWTGGLVAIDVEVWLPRLQLTSRLALESMLEKLGMRSAFSKKDADFSGMDGQRDLFLADVACGSFLEVDENGTRAGSVTAVDTNAKSAEPPDFRADHPFLFLIRDNETGCILFIGRVTDPQATAK